MKHAIALCLIVSVLTLAPAPGPAAEQVPTTINADRMRYDMDGNTITFDGAVEVLREGLTLTADSLVVHFSPREPGQKARPDLNAQDIEKLEAQGNVKIVQQEGGRTGTAARAVYLVRQGLLKMEGDPTLSDGANTLSGEVIKLYVKDNRSEVLGGKSRRVEAIFSTPKGLDIP